MSQIYGLLLLFLGLYIMFVDNTKRICAIIIAIACFNGATVGPFTSQQLISLCCMFALLREYRSFSNVWNNIKEVGLGGLIAVMVISFIFLALNAPYRHGITGFLSLVFKEWVCAYFYIFYGILCVKGRDINYEIIAKTCMLCLILLTGIGLINLVTKQSIFVNTFLMNESLGTRENAFMYSDRFRVQSMFRNPFDYGYVSVLFFLILWHMKQKWIITKRFFYIGVACALFGVLFCNCRTVIFVFGLSFLCYIFIAENVSTKLKYFLIGLIGIVLIGIFVPSAWKYVEYVFSAFDENSEVSGSSMEMRDLQYAATLYYIKDNLWFGLGENYYYYNFWEKGAGTTELLGLEGVHLKYLLERGIVGLSLYVTYYFLLLRRLFAIRHADRMLAGLSMSVIVAYLSFSVMTGELRSLIPTLFFAGLLLGLSNSKKHVQPN